ncbi:MAG: DUF4493 domain-containing protein [Alistipes sp.]|nr:DUF4493 domain-containing protein [Alistipes sp.]
MKKLLLIASVAMMTVACQKVSVEQIAGPSELKLNLSASGAVRSVAAGQADGGITIDVPNLSDFSLTITGVDYNRTWSSVAEYSSDERFQAGMYDVSIEYGDIAEEGYDKPYFFATKNVEVFERNRTTNVELVATVGNAIVEIAMTDSFKGYFVSHEFTLTTASNTFTLEENPAQHLFVAPQQSVKIDCTCVRQANAAAGTTEKLATQSIDVAARTRYIVKYDLQEAGSVTVSISLNDEVIDTIELPIELNENA